jgi:uncharacterized membrane protein
LPHAKREEHSVTLERRVSAEVHSGPLPDPELLRRYEQIHPGTAAIIIGTYQAQSEHRRHLERKVVEGSERRANLGQVLGFIVLLLTILVGGVVALRGEAAAGATIVGVAVGSGALVYVVGGRPSRSEHPAGRGESV